MSDPSLPWIAAMPERLVKFICAIFVGFELRCKDTMKKLGFANFFAKKIKKMQILSRKGMIMQAFSHFHRFTYAMYPHKWS